MAVEGLAIYVPAGEERATALAAAVSRSGGGAVRAVHLHRLATIRGCRSGGSRQSRYALGTVPPRRTESRASLAARSFRLPAVESIARHDGRVSLRVRGVEFATLDGGDLHLRVASSGIRRASAIPPRFCGWWKNSTARDRPRPKAASIRSTGSFRRHGWNRRPGRNWMSSTPRCGRIRCMDRCRRSRAASAAFWICWRWIIGASGGGGIESIGRSSSATAGARLLDARAMASEPEANSRLTDIFPASNCGRSRRGCCWSHLRWNSIQPRRPFWAISHRISKWSESGWR